jgi:hypothetical protein
MTPEQELNSFVDESLTERLERLNKLYRSGWLKAVPEALDTCCLLHVPPPEWLCIAVAELVRKTILSERRGGRTGNYLAEVRQRRIHRMRWAVVLHLKENCPDRKLAWGRAYSAASHELRGTVAQGTAESMKVSYRLMMRDLKISGKFPSRTAMRHEASELYRHRERLLKTLGVFSHPN